MTSKKPIIKATSAQVQDIEIGDVIPYERNPKNHSPEQINKIVRIIEEVGFQVPILIDKDNVIIAGHGRLLAAKKLGLTSVPCIQVNDLTPEQVRTFRIADNRVAEARWKKEFLNLEIKELEDLDVDLKLLGFDVKELENLKLDTSAYIKGHQKAAVAWQNRNPEMDKVARLAFNDKSDQISILYECPHERKSKHNHHFDYKRPYEVIRLCYECHRLEHRRLRGDLWKN